MRRLRRRQTVSGPFNPLSLRPALWLRADRGVYSDGSRQFAAASNHWLTIASNATLQVGDINWSIGGWVYFDSVAADQIIAAKINTAGTDSEYMLWMATSDKKLRLTVRNTANTTSTTHIHTTVLTTGTWYFVYAYHDSVNDTLNIGVNGVENQTTGYTGGVRTSGNAFRFGCRSDETVGKLDGRLDSWFFTKRLLTADEKTDLYNSGNGRTYATAISSFKDSSLQSWWNMNELTGSATDAHGSNTMSASATSPTANAGVASTAAANGDYVSLWMDQSGNGRHFAQTTASKRPTLSSTGINSKPSVLFDGVDDYLNTASTSLSGAFTLFMVFKLTGTAGNVMNHGTDTGTVDGFALRPTNNPTSSVRRTNQSAMAALGLNWGVDNATKITTLMHNGTHASHLIRVNGVDTGATTYSTFNNDVGIAATSTAIYLGAKNTSANFCNGHVAEVLLVERYMTAAQAKEAERELGRLYGVSI